MKSNSDGQNLNMSVPELIEDTSMGKPHVVILGAGASIAALPNGDKNGLLLPQMSNFIDLLGLANDLEKNGIHYKNKNFEEIYSDLESDIQNTKILSTINDKIWNYFSKLKLPLYPTIYDYLVLSLRKKDLIATFNWDPLLYQACWRHNKKVNLPTVVYLHGNVSVGYCLADMKMGLIGTNCSVCNKPFVPSKILYPIKKKDYNLDLFINGEWKTLESYLNSAYALTIFGYSAPSSDVEAVELMRTAWRNSSINDLAQVEIIDIKDEAALRSTWDSFIFEGHYDCHESFFQSMLYLFPRRSCEALWNATMECRFLENNPIPTNLGFEGLWSWFNPLTIVENRKSTTK